AVRFQQVARLGAEAMVVIDDQDRAPAAHRGPRQGRRIQGSHGASHSWKGRYLHRNARAATDRADDRNRPVERGEAIGETAEAAARTRGGATDTVVVDLDAQMI